MIIIITFLIIFLALSVAVFASVKFFYRDPERGIVQAKDKLLSPADGTVVSVRKYMAGETPTISKGGRSFKVQELAGTDILDADGALISIHISPLDIHTIRSPIDGEIIHLAKIKGGLKFMRDPYFEVENERVSIVLETSAGKLGIIIVGAPIASSVKTMVGLGDRVYSGQRIARIRLGSLASLVIPAETRLSPLVRCGEKVMAGLSIVAGKTDVSDTRPIEECYKAIRSTVKERIFLAPLAGFVVLKKIYTYLLRSDRK
ncbi:MAG: phosphatidylserine decarboxylase [Nitrososphaerota archaeon]